MLTITNRSKQLLIVAKNSGPSVYLGPGDAAVMPRTEIDGNAKIEKLVRAGSLSVSEAVPEAAPEAAPPAVPPAVPEAAAEPSEEDGPRSKKARPQKR